MANEWQNKVGNKASCGQRKKVIVEDLFLMATSCEGPSGAQVGGQPRLISTEKSDRRRGSAISLLIR
jgi:hypothetical protein